MKGPFPWGKGGLHEIGVFSSTVKKGKKKKEPADLRKGGGSGNSPGQELPFPKVDDVFFRGGKRIGDVFCETWDPREKKGGTG